MSVTGRVAVPAIAVLVVLAAAGCHSGTTWATQSPTESPRESVLDATAKSATLASLVGSLTVTDDGAQAAKGTFTEQMDPTSLLDLEMTVSDGAISGGAKDVRLSEIIDNPHSVIYLSAPGFTSLVGKPWYKASPVALAADKDVSALDQASHGPASLVGLLAGVSQARDDGQQVVGGVPTTRYTGTVDPAAALAAAAPDLQSLLSEELASVTGISFTVWIDGQHYYRKLQVQETSGGHQTVTTIDVASFNEPVDIALPPASQVAESPLDVQPVPSAPGGPIVV